MLQPVASQAFYEGQFTKCTTTIISSVISSIIFWIKCTRVLIHEEKKCEKADWLLLHWVLAVTGSFLEALLAKAQTQDVETTTKWLYWCFFSHFDIAWS